MKAVVFSLLFGVLLHSKAVRAQSPDLHEKFVEKQALLYADSLVKAFCSHNISKYIDLSYPGAVLFYGGKSGFERFLENAMSSGQYVESLPHTQLHQLLKEGEKEWQCVVEKISYEAVDGRKATVRNFMVGRSYDDGKTWTFFEPALTSYKVHYVMPDAYVNIPARKVEY